MVGSTLLTSVTGSALAVAMVVGLAAPAHNARHDISDRGTAAVAMHALPGSVILASSRTTERFNHEANRPQY